MSVELNYYYSLVILIIVSLICIVTYCFTINESTKEGLDSSCLSEVPASKVVVLPLPSTTTAKWYNGNRVNYDLLMNIINIFGQERDDILNRFPVNFNIGTISSAKMNVDENNFPSMINPNNIKITGNLPNITLNMILPKSLQGIQGQQGDRGLQGETGPQGDVGPKGDHGYC